MKRSRATVAILALTLPLLASTAGAQAASEDKEAKEAIAYQEWFLANGAKETDKAIELASAYLKQFPDGQYADYLRKWMASARGAQLQAAIKARNTAEIVRIGKSILAADPDNLNLLITVALNIRTGELFASPPRFDHAAEAAEYSRRAIKLIEGGKLPAGVDAAKWNRNATLAWLYQDVAIVEARNGQREKALAAYDKSSALDPGNVALGAYNLLACGSLHKDRYDEAVQKYQSLPDADRPAALDAANAQADAVIDCWARFIALATARNLSVETRQKVASALADLYKYRHPDDPEGYQKLIEERRKQLPPGRD